MLLGGGGVRADRSLAIGGGFHQLLILLLIPHTLHGTYRSLVSTIRQKAHIDEIYTITLRPRFLSLHFSYSTENPVPLPVDKMIFMIAHRRTLGRGAGFTAKGVCSYRAAPGE